MSRRVVVVLACSLLAVAVPASGQTRERGAWWPHPIWGADDQAGASNWITPEKVLQAVKLVRTGRIYELEQVYEHGMPIFGDRTFSLHIPGGPTYNEPLGKNMLIGNDEFLCAQVGQVGTQFDVDPQSTKKFILPYGKVPPGIPGSECWLEIRYFLKDNTRWAPRGYEVATAQLALSRKMVPFQKISLANFPKLNYEFRKNSLTIFGSEFQINFDIFNALIREWIFNGVQIVSQGPKLNIWRAPTDNDFGNRMLKVSGIWRKAGDSRKLKAFNFVKTGESKAEVHVLYDHPDVASQFRAVYTILGDGVVVVQNDFITDEPKLPEIPRVGVKMVLPKDWCRTRDPRRVPQTR